MLKKELEEVIKIHEEHIIFLTKEYRKLMLKYVQIKAKIFDDKVVKARKNIEETAVLKENI